MQSAPNRFAVVMRSLGVAAALAVSVSACQSDAPTPANTPVGSTTGAPVPSSGGTQTTSGAATRIVQWAEPDVEHAALEAIAPPKTVVLIDTAEKKQALLAKLPTSGDKRIDPAVIEQSDIQANVLVLGGYPNCLASSKVSVNGSTVQFERIPTPAGSACAWAPYTIDVWEIPRTALGAGPYDVVGSTAR